MGLNKITTKDKWDIYFAPGKIDPWCVYVRHAPSDKEYFFQLKILADKYGKQKVYDDFLKVYNLVDNTFDTEKVLKNAEDIDSNYHENTTLLWVVLHMTMIAEERKEKAILKKRIKHLGVYNLLFDEYDIDYITTYMRHKDWKELDKLMKERNI